MKRLIPFLSAFFLFLFFLVPTTFASYDFAANGWSDCTDLYGRACWIKQADILNVTFNHTSDDGWYFACGYLSDLSNLGFAFETAGDYFFPNAFFTNDNATQLYSTTLSDTSYNVRLDCSSNLAQGFLNSSLVVTATVDTSLPGKYLVISDNTTDGHLFPNITSVSTENASTNVAPTVGTITLSPNPVQVNNSVNASASFTDADSGDTHTATAHWGDGSSDTACTITEPSGSTPGSASCPRSSGYAAANVYPVTITVSDGTATGISPVGYASVYNPTAQGLFSAGQRFSSPAGAYPQTPSLTGSVSFGLVYKYQGTMPTSDRQFTMKFNAANLTFNATSVTSLVVANGFATLTGTGTINGGSHTYNFFVTGVDGGDIRIQITDPANNNAIIYDTQPGDPVTATPSTTVTGLVVAHN